MNSIIESLTGMNKMSDQVIATDLLVSAKSAVRSYSIALTEATTPELRLTLRNHLNAAIATHEKIFNYMLKKGYYDAYNMSNQYAVDMKVTDTALKLKD
ncbi:MULTISPECIES: spore coat protein [Clostridium]|uniref:Spore coat protein n=1 Tax=Clostridium manihotivorum TaxID=2320868 RepID=A0A3R5QV07_9CLOT|nr:MULTISPECIES: spore coat protein [Clostridium]QAA32954.1 spore coat protein [Clostridium manihotivorum]